LEIICPVCGRPGELMSCGASSCQVYHRISEVCDFPEKLLDPQILERYYKCSSKPYRVELEEEEEEFDEESWLEDPDIVCEEWPELMPDVCSEEGGLEGEEPLEEEEEEVHGTSWMEGFDVVHVPNVCFDKDEE